MKFSSVKKKLSPLSLQPFEAYQLENPEICWLNTSLLTEYGYDLSTEAAIEETKRILIDDYAYMVINDDVGTPLTSRSRVFYGEIYGSNSEVSNLGGVRCGIAKDFQVKGIGRNQLTGQFVDYWHSHGGASLEEGIREAFWAEYFHYELDEGAIRVAAIISTSHSTPFDIDVAELGINTLPVGALILREPSIRPSHFERVIYFNPLESEQFEHYCDVKRTKECISNIRSFLPAGDTLKEQFKALARVYASECAKLRIRCILHGSITSSNTCLDGRLIDFGTASGLPDHGNYRYNPSQPPIWSNHLSFTRLMDGLLYYVNKYHQDCKCDDDKIDSMEIIKHFFNHHYEDMLQELLYLSGIDIKISGAERTEDVINIVNYADTLMKVVTTKSEREKKLSGYTGTAYYPLSKILIELVSESPNLISFLKGDQELMDEVKTNFEIAVNSSKRIIDDHINIENYLKVIEINTRLRNSKPESLYKNYISIYNDIEAMEIQQKTKNLNLTQYMDEKISSTRRMTLILEPGEALLKAMNYTKYGCECVLFYQALEDSLGYRFSFPANDSFCLVFGKKIPIDDVSCCITDKKLVVDVKYHDELLSFSLPNGSEVNLPSDVKLPLGDL